MSPIAIILLVLTIHLGVGLLWAPWFLARGIARLDPAARGSSIAFRLLIAPGVVALWPVLLVRLARARRERAA